MEGSIASRVLHLHGFQDQVDLEELRDEMQRFGIIRDIRQWTSPQQKRHVFVVFDNHEPVEQASGHYHGFQAEHLERHHPMIRVLLGIRPEKSSSLPSKPLPTSPEDPKYWGVGTQETRPSFYSNFQKDNPRLPHNPGLMEDYHLHRELRGSRTSTQGTPRPKEHHYPRAMKHGIPTFTPMSTPNPRWWRGEPEESVKRGSTRLADRISTKSQDASRSSQQNIHYDDYENPIYRASGEKAALPPKPIQNKFPLDSTAPLSAPTTEIRLCHLAGEYDVTEILRTIRVAYGVNAIEAHKLSSALVADYIANGLLDIAERVGGECLILSRANAHTVTESSLRPLLLVLANLNFRRAEMTPNPVEKERYHKAASTFVQRAEERPGSLEFFFRVPESSKAQAALTPPTRLGTSHLQAQSDYLKQENKALKAQVKLVEALYNDKIEQNQRDPKEERDEPVQLPMMKRKRSEDGKDDQRYHRLWERGGRRPAKLRTRSSR